MAEYHFHMQIISRRSGRSTIAASSYTSGSSVKHVRSVIASAAYRAAEKIEDVTQNITHDFTHKSGVVYSNIQIPENAPREFLDRETLWNTAEQTEKRCDARLAREIDIAMPRDFDRGEQIRVLDKLANSFASEGMCVDYSLHDTGNGNPHAHILLTVRDVDETGFIKHDKSRKEWNKKEKLVEWRERWADICNEKFQEKGLDIRLDHRSYEEQGIDKIPSIHLGHEAHKMEQRGIKTERGNINREITAQNATKLKNKYIDLTKKIGYAEHQISWHNQKTQQIGAKISDIYRFQDNIKAIRQSIEETQANYDNIGVFGFKEKNELKQELKELEEVKTRIETSFYKRYGRDIDKSDFLLQQYQNELRAPKFVERVKLSELRQQKDNIELEYKKLKVNAEKYYFFEAGEFDKRTEFSQDIKYQAFIIDAENQLNTMTADEYRNITGIERVITRGYDLSR